MRRHHFLGRIPFQLDPSCKLWLPFRRYGSEQSKIWDISGNNNHGIITGAVPAQIPTLSGVALVANGGMEDGDPPTGWSAYNSPETFEQSGVQKHTGSYSTHIVDSTPSRGGFYQTISIITNKQYKVSFWYYIVSGSIRVELDYPSVYDLLSKTGSWCYFEKIFTRISTYSRIYFYNSSASVAAEFYIDDVSVQEVVGSTGLGWSFDGGDDVVTIPQSTSINNPVAITMLAWVMNLDRSTDYPPMVCKSDGSGYYYLWEFQTSYKPVFYADGININWGNCASTALPFDKFSQIGVAYSAGDLRYYLNGVSDGNYSVTNANISANTANLLIGKRHDGLFGKFIFGEVLIFNRALSAQEIRDYFERTRHIYGI